jgi:hypothetical protein
MGVTSYYALNPSDTRFLAIDVVSIIMLDIVSPVRQYGVGRVLAPATTKQQLARTPSCLSSWRTVYAHYLHV